jgi:hypothetical protein
MAAGGEFYNLKIMAINKNIFAALFFIIFIFGAGLRIHNINKYDLWFDELSSDIYSAHQAEDMEKSEILPVYLSRISHDPHSPLYYFLVYCYSLIFGGGKSLRIISLIFSLLSMFIFYRLSRVFLKRSESLLAVLLMILSPLHIWYAQEARGYTMALFFTLLSAYFYMQALRINRLLYWALFAISAALAVYSSYYSVFLIVISGLYIFYKNDRRYIKKWLLSILAILVLLLPLVLVFIPHCQFVKNSFWLLKPRIGDIFITLAAFNLGYSSGYGGLLIGLALFFALFIYGTFSFYKANKEYALALFLLTLLPIIVTYLFSIWYVPVYITRQFFIFTPFYYLLIAKGLGSIKNRLLQGVAGIFAVLILICTLSNYYEGFILSSKNQREFYAGIHQKKNYMDLLTGINNKIKENDIVVTTDVQSFFIVNKYYSSVQDLRSPGCRTAHLLFYPPALSNLEKKYLRITDWINTLSEDDKKELYSISITSPYFTKESNTLLSRADIKLVSKFPLGEIKTRRIWLISSIWDKQGPLPYNYHLLRNSLSGHLEKKISIEKDGMLVELYARKERQG